MEYYYFGEQGGTVTSRHQNQYPADEKMEDDDTHISWLMKSKHDEKERRLESVIVRRESRNYTACLM